MTSPNYDFKKMANDPKTEKLLKDAIRQMVEGWKEADPNDPQLKDTEEIVDLGFRHVKKHGKLGN